MEGDRTGTLRAKLKALSGGDDTSIDEIVGSTLVELAHVVVLVLSETHRIVYANPFLERLTGYSSGELEGEDWFERFVHPKDEDAVLQRFARAIAGEATNANVNDIIAKDGSRLAIEWYDRTIRAASGDVIALLVVGHDVTQRERATWAESITRSSNQLLEATFQNSMVCLAYLDTDFNFVRVNERYAAADGRPPSHFVGKNHFDLYPSRENQEIFKTVLRTGEPYSVAAKPFEYEYNKERGVTHWDWTLTPVGNGTGEVVGLVLALHNVSVRVEAIEAVRVREEQLAEELLQKETLLQEIHHRVKNNLQVVSSLLNLQVAHVDEPNVRQLYRESQDRLRAMSLVHQVLHETGNVSRVDCERYMARLVNGLSSSHATPACRIRATAQAKGAYLDLQQATPCALIVGELVTNAFKHAFSGRQDGTIVVELKLKSEGLATLSVSDDGNGMPPQVLEEPKTLGLKLVRALSQQLGGEPVITGGAGTRIAISFRQR